MWLGMSWKDMREPAEDEEASEMWNVKQDAPWDQQEMKWQMTLKYFLYYEKNLFVSAWVLAKCEVVYC